MGTENIEIDDKAYGNGRYLELGLHGPSIHIPFFTEDEVQELADQINVLVEQNFDGLHNPDSCCGDCTCAEEAREGALEDDTIHDDCFTQSDLDESYQEGWNDAIDKLKCTDWDDLINTTLEEKKQ